MAAKEAGGRGSGAVVGGSGIRAALMVVLELLLALGRGSLPLLRTWRELQWRLCGCGSRVPRRL